MSELIELTPEQAISCLPEGDTIHTFYASGFLCGADWPRQQVLDYIAEKSGASIAGPFMRGMKHGICLDRRTRLFCEHVESALVAIETGGAK